MFVLLLPSKDTLASSASTIDDWSKGRGTIRKRNDSTATAEQEKIARQKGWKEVDILAGVQRHHRPSQPPFGFIESRICGPWDSALPLATTDSDKLTGVFLIGIDSLRFVCGSF